MTAISVLAGVIGYGSLLFGDSESVSAPAVLVSQGSGDVERTDPTRAASPVAEQGSASVSPFHALPPRVRAVLLQRWPSAPALAAAPWWHHVGVAAAWAPITHLANRDLLTKFCVTRH
ncbi:hypothetical protein H7H78_10350 [Mycobacterium shinjukuense]|uniref:Uncharacterized protein n=1 Tax=Mycobacterium shinjukuense TaxID=398694 RepID=A0A7I7MNH7_9MYCO|nr:hypothetical protein [Mycobacterium shinjukuense]MCV6985815.1 hypothetical protein [Mycobacterium shinjukuense]ORB71782.1 hypothetical protein BST45_02005 [Mycobacterium shinjukuense]BBX73695.1 hypothetical protein MSHI_16010 [Mycobacterium shinjukuense]